MPGREETLTSNVISTPEAIAIPLTNKRIDADEYDLLLALLDITPEDATLAESSSDTTNEDTTLLESSSDSAKRVLLETDSLETLQLSTRLRNFCGKKGLKTVRDLVAIADNIENERNIGTRCVQDLSEILNEMSQPAPNHLTSAAVSLLSKESGSTRYIFDPFGLLTLVPPSFHRDIHAEPGVQASLLNTQSFPNEASSSSISKKTLEDFGNTSLGELGVCVSSFQRNGIRTIADFQSLPHERLLMLRGVGEVKIRQVREAIDRYERLISAAQSSSEQTEDIEACSVNNEPRASDDTALMRVHSMISEFGLEIPFKRFSVYFKGALPTGSSNEEDGAQALFNTIVSNSSIYWACYSRLSQIADKMEAGELDSPHHYPNLEIWNKAAEDLHQLRPNIVSDSIGSTLSFHAPGIDSWLSSLNERQREAVNLRAEGKTLAACGEMMGVTRERVRQLISKSVSKMPAPLKNGWAAKLVREYQVTPEQFSHLTGESERVFGYLNVANNSAYDSRKNIEELANDTTYPDAIRQAALSVPSDKFLFLESGERIPIQKRSIVTWLLKGSQAEGSVTLERLYDDYLRFCSEHHLSFSERPSLNPQSRKAFGAFLDRLDNVINVPRPKSDSNSAGVRLYNGNRDFSRLAKAIEEGPIQDAEISSVLIANSEFYAELLSDYDIHDGYELHYILKRFAPRSEKLSFGRIPIITIGDGDRCSQVLELIKEIGPVDSDCLGEEYERRYGVSKPAFCASFLDGFESYKRNGKYQYIEERLNIEQRKLLATLLDRDYLSLETITHRLSDAFPDANRIQLTDAVLLPLEYRVSHKLIIRRDIDERRYFRDLIRSKETFGINDLGVEVFSHPGFEAELNIAIRAYDIIEFDKGQYIGIKRLEMIPNPPSKEELIDFTKKVCEFQADETPFTLKSLRRAGFHHSLDRLMKDAGMTDTFFESLISVAYVGGAVKRTSICGTPLYCITAGRYDSTDFLTYILSLEKAIELDDLVSLLEADYGIIIDAQKLKPIISRSGLFLQERLDMVFESKDDYERMARSWI